MHLKRLTLTHFRNYAQQAFDLAPGMVLLLGENAQGKTNVLEAAFMLATGKSDRAAVDADLISWDARGHAQPHARIVGHVGRAAGDVEVDVVIAGRAGAGGRMIASKRFKLNGVARRAADMAGSVLAVMFTTDDMELVRGAPSGRRRYLDGMLAQAGRPYARALQRYGKVVTRRNALLKRIGEGGAKREELAYWDEELARDGATLIATRARALARLAPAAAAAHARLSGEREDLGVGYQPRLDGAWTPARLNDAPAAEIAAALEEHLRAGQARDIGAGLTLSGPHRDDLALTLGGEPAASFASRGQQRTAALALRLAEAQFLRDASGEQPILLLDDVLSELDEQRRASVLAAIEAEQVLVTSADPDRFPEGLVRASQVWRIAAGAAHLQA
jgi:DNA replication and repair protein RecF